MRRVAAAAILVALVPPMVGEAVTPPWEDVGPVQLWARGALTCSLVLALAWAEGTLFPVGRANAAAGG